MSYKLTWMAAIAVAAAMPATAQVIGGSLGVEYSTPVDASDFGGTTYFGGIEYGLTRDISISADLSGYRLDNINTDASSLTLHGIYHVSETLSVGAFVGGDKREDNDAQVMYGVEAGSEFLGGEVEGYIGRVDGENDSATILGADGTYSLNNGFSIIGNAGFALIDDNDVNRIAIGGQYDVPNGPQIYAELGNASIEVNGSSDSKTFIGVGARVAIGAKRGTTFGPRGVFEILPGF